MLVMFDNIEFSGEYIRFMNGTEVSMTFADGEHFNNSTWGLHFILKKGSLSERIKKEYLAKHRILGESGHWNISTPFGQIAVPVSWENMVEIYPALAKEYKILPLNTAEWAPSEFICADKPVIDCMDIEDQTAVTEPASSKYVMPDTEEPEKVYPTSAPPSEKNIAAYFDAKNSSYKKIIRSLCELCPRCDEILFLHHKIYLIYLSHESIEQLEYLAWRFVKYHFNELARHQLQIEKELVDSLAMGASVVRSVVNELVSKEKHLPLATAYLAEKNYINGRAASMALINQQEEK